MQLTEPSIADGPFSRRWCHIFSIAISCHDVVSLQEVVAGALLSSGLLHSPDNPLISITSLQQLQDVKSTFCLRRNVLIMEMSLKSVGMFMLHVLHWNIKIPNYLTGKKESSCESTEV